MNSNWKLLPAALLVAVLAIAGCGGGGDTTPTEPTETAYEMALDAIQTAESAEAAQAAYDDVDQTAVTGDEANKLMAALNTRLTEFRAADQMAALAAAAGAIDTSDLSTQAAIDAANVAIGALQMALDAATDVSDTSMYSAQLAAAQTAVQAAVVELARQGRIADQKSALMSAAGAVDTSDLTTREAIAAAEMAIAGLQAALDAAVDVSAADRAMYQSQLDGANADVSMAVAALDLEDRQDVQSMTLTGALDAARPAVRAVDDDSTDAEVSAAEMALAALQTAINNAADLSGAEVGAAQGTHDTLLAQLNAAKMARTAALDEADKAADAAMAIMAAKLYAGITAPSTTAAAVYATDDITVTNGAATATLMVDEDAVVDALHDWDGMSFTDEDGTYEAQVYSNIGDPTVTMGAAFNVQYTLSTDAATMGELTTLDAGATGDGRARVDSPSFDQSAGTKEFELPTNTVRVMLSGSYHGVSGTYYCTPADANTNCSATKADMGFSLGGGAWTFKPGNAEALLMDTSAPDENYASYGWWLHTDADGKLTASAFHAYHGTDPGTVGIADLRGEATYEGGAAGKYALSSSTGGTNDAGHFTADVELTATFGVDHTISGKVDNFVGGDGMARDWSVELNETDISDEGVIDGLGGDANDVSVGTVWTIGETAAAAAGAWSGNLREQDSATGVPATATGTFHSTYGTDGSMVGAFGADEE